MRARRITFAELVLGAIFVAGIVLATSPIWFESDRARLAREADRLARALDLATQEAMFTGRPVAFHATSRGYGFGDDAMAAAWKSREEELLRERVLPARLRIAGIAVNGATPAAAAPLVFAPAQSPPPFSITLVLGTSSAVVYGTGHGRTWWRHES